MKKRLRNFQATTPRNVAHGGLLKNCGCDRVFGQTSHHPSLKANFPPLSIWIGNSRGVTKERMTKTMIPLKLEINEPRFSSTMMSQTNCLWRVWRGRTKLWFVSPSLISELLQNSWSDELATLQTSNSYVYRHLCHSTPVTWPKH